MELDEIGVLREDLRTQRQRLIHDRILGEARRDFRESYLSIREQEAELTYEELKILNRTSTEAKIFERPRKKAKPNRRARMWLNLVMMAMVLAVVFFFAITPRLTPTHEDGVEDLDPPQPGRQSLP